MSALRLAAKHTRVLSQSLRANASQTRSFYSPFAVLSENSPLTSAPSSSTTPTPSTPYEHEHASRTVYVVSEPDPSYAPYAVPAGAYPTSAPYVNFAPAPAPKKDAHVSSTSPALAHPTLTRRVPTNEAGVGESAAVRHAQAPGEMGRRGGSEGGLGLMDSATTKPGVDGELAERSPPPIQDVAKKYAQLGKEAWKARK
ncbi:hypothetical protein EWM64_g4413 [Hericium alpestre]|uniref:Uncharacterized protein n=1 Tax=Hericium alpestre TaxID=135208 RepID=A0A4Y9ZYJ7_9AGAM|nr:hypothetical protein EWM64_g4413 [Hericium alpestre]